MTKYLARQYRPAYFSGFENEVARGIAYDDLTSVPWCENFKHSGFIKFTVEPYFGDELIIEAHYEDGRHRVVGFALSEESEAKAPDGGLLRNNWRYKPHIQY